jgi:microcin C transport system substrate-binding protein
MKWIFRAAVIAIAAAAPLGALAQSQAEPEPAPQWHHGVSLFGSVKYPADFKHFDYVNPDAPKTGAVRLSALGTFDNFNVVIAGVKGSLAAGIDLINGTLMVPALDEVSTEYGQIAESMRYPADFSSATYRLRPQAKWHDGEPITPEDVIYSLDVFKANSPMYAAYYRHVVKAEKTGEHEVTFTFDAPGNRELPHIIGQLTILPKHWWEGTDKNGKKRDITATTLEPPLGSGAYRVKSFEPGRTIVYERVKDFWGQDVPANVGSNNFAEVRFEYFRDPTVAIEAFKADQVDFRSENSAKSWATAYDFPAARDKRVVKEEFPIRNVGRMQGFAFNTRRDKFKDPRVRRAFNLVFDFEEMNRQMFYGQYTRIDSYFEGTELAWNWRPKENDSAAFTAKPAAANGLPDGKELEILQGVRDKVPPEVFTTPYRNPAGGSPEATRAN